MSRLFVIINLKHNGLSNLKIVAVRPARIIYMHKNITEINGFLCVPSYVLHKICLA